jgi:hypothetical protein
MNSEGLTRPRLLVSAGVTTGSDARGPAHADLRSARCSAATGTADTSTMHQLKQRSSCIPRQGQLAQQIAPAVVGCGQPSCTALPASHYPASDWCTGQPFHAAGPRGYQSKENGMPGSRHNKCIQTTHQTAATAHSQHWHVATWSPAQWLTGMMEPQVYSAHASGPGASGLRRGRNCARGS